MNSKALCNLICLFIVFLLNVCCMGPLAARAYDGEMTLSELAAAMRRLEQSQPPLRGMIRCLRGRDDVDVQAAGRLEYQARFFRRDGDLRIDYLAQTFAGSLDDVSPNAISSILIERGGELVLEANRRAPALMDVNVFEGRNPESLSAGRRLQANLRIPLTLHFAAGETTISDLLQLPTTKVDFANSNRQLARITTSKKVANAATHDFTIALDPKRAYCATFLSDHFEQGGAECTVTVEIALIELGGGVFAVKDVRQTEHISPGPASKTPARVTLFQFSDLQTGDFGEDVFSLDSVKRLASESLVIDVSPAGEHQFREQVVTGGSDRVAIEGAARRTFAERVRTWAILASVVGLLAGWLCVRRRRRASSN